MASGRIRSSFNSLRMDRMLVDARRPQDPLQVMEAVFLMDMVAMVAALLPVFIAFFVTLPQVHVQAMAALPRCLLVVGMALPQALQAMVDPPVLLLLLLHMPLLQDFATRCAEGLESMVFAM